MDYAGGVSVATKTKPAAAALQARAGQAAMRFNRAWIARGRSEEFPSFDSQHSGGALPVGRTPGVAPTGAARRQHGQRNRLSRSNSSRHYRHAVGVGFNRTGRPIWVKMVRTRSLGNNFASGPLWRCSASGPGRHMRLPVRPREHTNYRFVTQLMNRMSSRGHGKMPRNRPADTRWHHPRDGMVPVNAGCGKGRRQGDE